jgi:hypothetical protein
LKSAGAFETEGGGGAKPNDLAAIQVMPGVQEWILAKVIQHDPETGVYTLADEDIESNKSKFLVTSDSSALSVDEKVLSPYVSTFLPEKVFHLPEQQVVLLENIDRLSKGDIVFAVYPDTTSFYQATIVQAPRRMANTSAGSFVLVNFIDDADADGITHDKAVLLNHVMRPPYGAIVQ